MPSIPIHKSRQSPAEDMEMSPYDSPHSARASDTSTAGSYTRSALLEFASSPLARAPDRLVNHFAPILDPANKSYLEKCFVDGRAPAADLDLDALAWPTRAEPAALPTGIASIVCYAGIPAASLVPHSLAIGAGSVPMPIRSCISSSLNPGARPFPVNGLSATPSHVITPAALSAFACSLSASRKAPPPPSSLPRQIHALPIKPMGGLPPVRPAKEAMALPTPMSLPHVAPLGPDWLSASRQRRDSSSSAMSFESSASESSGERPQRLRFKEAMQQQQRPS